MAASAGKTLPGFDYARNRDWVYKEIAPILGVAPKVLALRYECDLEKLRKKLPGSVSYEFESN